MRSIALRPFCLLAGSAAALLGGAPQDAPEKSQLSVLYVAEPGDARAARRAAFQDFLERRFESAMVSEHGALDPAAVAACDVVLLDWHQGGDEDEAPPLGLRDAWDKPCVLLGSAGLKIAMKWEVLGGSG
jgi:hypothetical protein